MKHPQRVTPVLTVILAAGVGGYWLGHHGLGTSELMTTTGAAQTNGPSPFGPVIYYRDPDGRPLYSLEPKQTPDGRPYRAVFAGEDISFDLKAATAMPGPAGGRRIIYYRNPMGLPGRGAGRRQDRQSKPRKGAAQRRANGSGRSARHCASGPRRRHGDA
jgi:membrane fusion protein, copper/silver efflux system